MKTCSVAQCLIPEDFKDQRWTIDRVEDGLLDLLQHLQRQTKTQQP